MKIWIDIDNSPHVNFVSPLIYRLRNDGHEVTLTTRNVFETAEMCEKYGLEAKVIGRHMGKNRLLKVIGYVYRLIILYFWLPTFDVSFSLGGNTTSIVSFFRKNSKSVSFSDNDISYKGIAFKLSDRFIVPKTFTIPESREFLGKLIRFDGYKEEVYLKYLLRIHKNVDLPFDEYYILRAENLKANYVPLDSTTIVPEILRLLQNENIVFLPRYDSDRDYVNGYGNVHIPSGPVNGVRLVANSKGVLTGAGTLAREAALLGVPSVSFFPGLKLLSVDKNLFDEEKLFHSRDPHQIVNYIQSSKDSFKLSKLEGDKFEAFYELFKDAIR